MLLRLLPPTPTPTPTPTPCPPYTWQVLEVGTGQVPSGTGLRDCMSPLNNQLLIR